MTERRYLIEDDIELRAESVNGVTTITGYAAVYGRLSVEMIEERTRARFREIILPGAFDEVLQRNEDVVALWNHDPSQILGRRSAGTLELSAEKTGLRYTVRLGSTELDRYIAEKIQRREIRGSSFAFGDAVDDIIKDGGIRVREIRKIGRLVDVSPVTNPAYPDTVVAVRSVAEMPAEPKRSLDWLRLRIKAYG